MWSLIFSTERFFSVTEVELAGLVHHGLLDGFRRGGAVLGLLDHEVIELGGVDLDRNRLVADERENDKSQRPNDAPEVAFSRTAKPAHVKSPRALVNRQRRTVV